MQTRLRPHLATVQEVLRNNMFLTMLMVFLESEVMQRKVKKVRQEDEKEEADVPDEKVEVMTEGQRRNPSNSTTT